MDNILTENNRQSASMFRNRNRRYIKYPNSPTENVIISKSQNYANDRSSKMQHRFSEMGRKRIISISKLAVREDNPIAADLINMSLSKNLSEKQRRGKTSFQKKIADINFDSELFFRDKVRVESKQSSVANSYSTLPLSDNMVEELHYQMVEFQQNCKRVVKN